MSGMLEGKTAFVSGGCGGIGSAICDRFAREGAEVIAADLSQPAPLADGVVFCEYDLTREAVCQSTFAQLQKRWHQLPGMSLGGMLTGTDQLGYADHRDYRGTLDNHHINSTHGGIIIFTACGNTTYHMASSAVMSVARAASL